MAELLNIYCDESCHLEHDAVNNTAMVIGGIICPDSQKHVVNRRIREIKEQHGIKSNAEIKWNKVSPSKISLYIDLINYFFDNSDLHFRSVIVPDKRVLRHREFNQTHDEFYYKTYFRMLKTVLEPGKEYAIYIDIKDTRSQEKVIKLRDVLCNSQYDFDRSMIRNIQQIRSHEVELMGLADLFIGAMSYLHRGLIASETKLTLIRKIRQRSGLSLTRNTLYRADKINLLIEKLS